MATVQDVKDAQAKLAHDFDLETTAVATRIDKIQTDNAAAIKALQDQIAAGGTVSSADLSTLLDGLAAFQPVSDRLKVLGADPAQPIPPQSSDPNPPVAAVNG